MKWFLLLFAAATFAFSASSQAQDERQLLSEAQRAYTAGNTELAKSKFEQVLAVNPENNTAKSFLRMIRAQEAKDGPSGSLEKQLRSLVLPKVEFRDATFGSALEYLKQQAAKVSDNKVAVSFVVQLPEEFVQTKSVTLAISNVPFTEVLRYLGEMADVEFKTEKYAIVVRPKGAGRAQASPTAQ